MDVVGLKLLPLPPPLSVDCGGGENVEENNPDVGDCEVVVVAFDVVDPVNVEDVDLDVGDEEVDMVVRVESLQPLSLDCWGFGCRTSKLCESRMDQRWPRDTALRRGSV